MITARRFSALLVLMFIITLSGCAALDHAFCVPDCRSQTHNSSSLVSFLYPDGKAPPAQNATPELHVPSRVGLAFLPSQSRNGAPALDDAQKEDLLERIKQRFADRKFVSEIVIIPDYYLTTSRGYEGLEGVQRLYNIDLMALVSYDQVTYLDDNKLSLGYLTIVGAYVLKGTSRDITTLVDLAVVDPISRSLVIRAGGTNTLHGSSTLIDVQRDSRQAARESFSAATDQMIGNFGTALTKFESDIRSGRANVRVVAADRGGGGAMDVCWLLLLGALLLNRIYQTTSETARTPRARR